MKPSKSFLRGTSIVYAVFTICGCATMLSSIQNPKPIEMVVSNGQVKVTSGEKIDSAKVFKSYCSGGRQIKSLSLNMTYLEPVAPVGIPVNTSGQILKKVEQEYQCRVKRILYSLSLDS